MSEASIQAGGAPIRVIHIKHELVNGQLIPKGWISATVVGVKDFGICSLKLRVDDRFVDGGSDHNTQIHTDEMYRWHPLASQTPLDEIISRTHPLSVLSTSSC